MQILSTKNRAQNEKCMWGTFPPSLLSSCLLFFLTYSLSCLFFKTNFHLKKKRFHLALNKPFHEMFPFSCSCHLSCPFLWSFHLHMKSVSFWIWTHLESLPLHEWVSPPCSLVHDVPTFKVSQSSTINPQILLPHLMTKPSPNQVLFYQRVIKGQQGDLSWFNLMKRPSWPIFSLGLPIGKRLGASSHLVVP